jgi:hypothetical protein
MLPIRDQPCDVGSTVTALVAAHPTLVALHLDIGNYKDRIERRGDSPNFGFPDPSRN